LIDICLLLDDLGRVNEMHAAASKIVESWPSDKAREKNAERKLLEALQKRIEAKSAPPTPAVSPVPR